MKKTILAILTVCVLTTAAHAQTAVVVERPSLLSGLAETVGALVALPIVLPIAVAEGVVSGTAEAADTIMHGRKEVYVVPSQQAVAPAPVVVTPAPVVQTTVIRTVTPVTTTVVTRPAYEVVVPRHPVVVPVHPRRR